MNRRGFLSLAAASALASRGKGAEPLAGMGVATTSYLSFWRPRDTLEFLEHCHAMGAAGIQSAIHGDPAKIRSRAEELGMYVEAMVPMPENGSAEPLEKALQAAREAGATALRTGMLHGRRYITFKTLAEWEEWEKRARASIEQALPLLDRYRIPLGIENHKDWTADQLAELLEKHSSEYLGACLDFGNNISLLDDPMYVARKLAPHAVVTHVKDMGVSPTDDGFLLSEVPLGTGILDLQAMIDLVRQARAHTRFTLEMITRDPLPVACLNDAYWTTFPDRGGIYLARTLRLVHDYQSATPLPVVSNLPREQQLAEEDANVRTCLVFAREKLKV